MESKYEYKFSGTISIAPAQVSRHNPPAKEFGEAVLWFYANMCSDVNSQLTINKLVAAGKFTWLDWLSEHGFVTRTEKRRKLTIEDFYLDESANGTRIRLSLKCKNHDLFLLTIAADGSVRRCSGAQNDLIPTDEEGKIIIK